MKILASYPNRLATHRELKRDLEILATSGAGWAELSKRLASGFPKLEIFQLGFVQRYSFGWHLTQKGLVALEMMVADARTSRPVLAAPQKSGLSDGLDNRPL